MLRPTDAGRWLITDERVGVSAVDVELFVGAQGGRVGFVGMDDFDLGASTVFIVGDTSLKATPHPWVTVR